MRTDGIACGGVALRLVAALALVVLTWNPDGLSYEGWAIVPPREEGIATIGAAKAIVGILGVVLATAASAAVV